VLDEILKLDQVVFIENKVKISAEKSDIDYKFREILSQSNFLKIII
jgi:hypothetical protein